MPGSGSSESSESVVEAGGMDDLPGGSVTVPLPSIPIKIVDKDVSGQLSFCPFPRNAIPPLGSLRSPAFLSSRSHPSQNSNNGHGYEA